MSQTSRISVPFIVTHPDEEGIEAQHSAHNKTPQTASRIRVSWIVVLLIFVLLGVTAVMIGMMR